MLDADATWTTVLREPGRDVAIVSTLDVEGRQVCSLVESARPRSLIQIISGEPGPQNPPCAFDLPGT